MPCVQGELRKTKRAISMHGQGTTTGRLTGQRRDVQHTVRPVRSNETVIKACKMCKTIENIRGEDQGFEDGVERATDDDNDERGGEERRWEEREKK